MSRPVLLSNIGTRFQIAIPTGWFTTISMYVSRKIYNHLVTVDYQQGGVRGTAYIADRYNVANELMREMTTREIALSITSQDGPQTIAINAYYSTDSSIAGDDLQDDLYRSSRANVITHNKPTTAPEQLPDYSTFHIFVQDAPPSAQEPGAHEFDDMIIIVNVVKNFTPPPAVDTSSQALTVAGKSAIKDFQQKYNNPTGPGRYIPIPPVLPTPNYTPSVFPVAILGAGVSGLYIAMMLDSLGIKYELLEGSRRIGGRLYTHNFPSSPGKYQYYDVGAMRYPNTSFMQRTFDLARNRLGLQDKMLPYIRGNDNAFLHYNGISVTKAKVKATANSVDLFKFSQSSDGNIPDSYIAAGSGAFWNKILGNLRQLFVDNPFDVAFKKLQELDKHTVTSYLSFVEGIPYDTIKWYETMESRTGLFDASLTETVLASLVFNDPRFEGREIDWYCFDGGSEIIHKAMTEKVRSKPSLNYRAVALKETDGGASITVTFDRSSGPRQLPQTDRKYSNVISTMSLACLRVVDLDNIYLTNGQRCAIRQLAYTPSVKIGLQFRTPWWERLGIVGGQSSTDRPIRDIVYPSYGPDDSHFGSEPFQKSNCMIASYTGMEDSQRMGGLMKGRGSPEEKILLDLVIRDLAAVHNLKPEVLWEEYEDYFPWDFHRDQFQLGAFCQFGPGQFKNIYPHLTHPASRQQRLHFAGDATSTFHGRVWVAGALNSSWRVVMGLLQNHPELNPNPRENIIEKFTTIWGPSEEWDPKDLAVHNYIAQKLAEPESKNRQ
ncbi:hypothetical protein H0H81_005251 [Sphagnurus paluster]|uniref:Amine oxidase domain-containing protein n=1 Tax=Sphagnurus paluster TaxID=117069 RepID=A0A9P7FY75_9AGAR|nr:hypothetical protein H0H81_005251 [Sphagnurus paluster]